MKKNLLALALSMGVFGGSVSVFAQPPDFRGGDRGGDRDRGDRDRGERDRGDRGDGRGGSPGGGPPGGFPGGGGPPGGFPGGGGPPGGFSGGRGGFDPSSFIERLDRNGNGMLDPDEMEGPAGFMIARLQREDPSIRTDRPIPMSKIKEAFDRSRSGRESGDSGGSSGTTGGSDRGRDDTSERLNAAMTAPPLVPGFGGSALVLPPVLGFGPSAELMSVEVTPADIKEAEERLSRYDRNKDGFLAGDELSSRWSGNPLDFDRNGDGKLSVSELAVRAARMRIAQVEVAKAQNRKETDRRGNREGKKAEVPNPYNGRKSFASLSRALPEGLPGWFAEKDFDGDQQISMAEYSTTWTESLVSEFQSFDLNGDGFITPEECLAAVRNGASASGGGSPVAVSGGSPPSGTSSRSSSGSSRGSGSTSSASPAAAPATAGSSARAVGQPDQKTLEYVQKIIARNDKNKDGQLTADEWKDMLVDPSAADTNKDGRITALEYAQWMESRQQR
jgi:Ca2+-binding EF-hand superfamily protein